MTMPRVWTFFYGSYINLDVLKEADLVPENVERATLGGFDIRIAPRANLVRSDAHSVYGILATATHVELARLYKHSQDILGETYLPEAVLARTSSGDYRPALCYFCPDMVPRPAEAAYVNRIVVAARQFQFADEYIARVLAFAPK
ncbi:gamma-glutamylcyclotransferase [Pendulispora rubella]|uniref:Gamma-glutamylcyclotransferase n=1 Tax=Pendulispora rubella TaxID=2741070 RepID=A0ABZ2LAG9_9BACT